MKLRLISATIPFWVDVRLRAFDGRWMAVADLAGDHDIGLGLTAHEALEQALQSLSRPTVRDLLANAALPPRSDQPR